MSAWDELNAKAGGKTTTQVSGWDALNSAAKPLAKQTNLRMDASTAAAESQKANSFGGLLANTIKAIPQASGVPQAFSAGIDQVKQGYQQLTSPNQNIVQRGEGLLNLGAGAVNTAFSPLAPAFAPIGKGIESAGNVLANTPYMQGYGRDVANLPVDQTNTPERILQGVINASTIAGAAVPSLGKGLLRKTKAEIPQRVPVVSDTTVTNVPLRRTPSVEVPIKGLKGVGETQNIPIRNEGNTYYPPANTLPTIDFGSLKASKKSTLPTIQIETPKITPTETAIESRPKTPAYQQAEHEITTKMTELSQAGKRFSDENGNQHSYSSSFPQEIPAHLRRSELFRQVVEKYNEDIKPSGFRQKELAEIMQRMIDKREKEISIAKPEKPLEDIPFNKGGDRLSSGTPIKYSLPMREVHRKLNDIFGENVPAKQHPSSKALGDLVNVSVKPHETIHGLVNKSGIHLLEKYQKVSEVVANHEGYHWFKRQLSSSKRAELNILEREVAHLYPERIIQLRKQGYHDTKIAEEITADAFSDYYTGKRTFTGKVKEMFDRMLNALGLIFDNKKQILTSLKSEFANVKGTLKEHRAENPKAQPDAFMRRMSQKDRAELNKQGTLTLPKYEKKAPILAKPVPRETPVKIQKTGNITRSARNINDSLVKQGFDELSPDEQSKYTPKSYKEQVDKIAEMDADTAIAMAKGEKPVPAGVHGQILFNAVEAHAISAGDAGLLVDLAASPLGKKLSEAGQTLGGHGYNDNPNSPIKAIQEVQKARQDAVQRKHGDSAVKKETARAEAYIAKVKTSPQTVAEFIKSLTC
jgi:hypothetical protein